MDPLTAVGLASNIIAFVDFSSKLVKVAAEVRRSTSGVTEDIGDALAITQSLESMLAGLQTPSVPATAPHEDEKLVLLAKNCSKTCVDLQELVKKMKGKPSSSGLGPAWRVWTNGGKLAAMESRLEKFRGQIMIHVQMMMSHKASATHHLLEDLAKSQMAAQATKDSLAIMKDDILAAVRAEHENVRSQTSAIQELRKSIDAMSIAPKKSTESSQASAKNLLLETIREALVTLSTTAANVSADEQILEWLWFPDLFTREASIDRAHDGTYRWMLYSEPEKRVSFDAASSSGVSNFSSGAEAVEADLVPTALSPGETNEFRVWRKEKLVRLIQVEQQLHSKIRRRFVQWLEHDNGLFYISGKPGSGKSTLMKYIAEEEQTTDLLNSWAGDSRLVLARFFFWRAGGNLQKSARGLYRGILWEILRQCPGTAELVFPNFWHGNRRGNSSTKPAHRPPPELHELEAAFGTLSKNPKILQQAKICLFIDGLDEYEGDYWKLGKALKQACDSPNIKICAASRHYNEFQRLFVDDGVAHTWIRIHDLTRRDMTRFVTDELEGDERFGAIRHTSDVYDDIVSDVVGRAEGVFLWTKLVVEQLLKDMGNQCSIDQLRQRLAELPTGLDALFRQTLQRLDPVERRRLARTVLTMLFPTGRFAPLGSWVFIHSVVENLDDNPGLEDSILAGTIGPLMTREEISHICRQMEDRLRGRGQGLLEIGSPTPMSKIGVWVVGVRFTHRSVVDFLGSPDISQELEKSAGNFSPYNATVLGLLSILKHFPLETATTGVAPYMHTALIGHRNFGLIEKDVVELLCELDRGYMTTNPDSTLLLAEMSSLCRLVEQRSFLSKDGTVTLGAAPHLLHPFLSKSCTPAEVEDTITCYAICEASPGLAWKMVQSRSKILLQGSNNPLLVASENDLARRKTWASSFTKCLLEYSPDPNTVVTRCSHPGNRRYWFFQMPLPTLGTWTTWTVLLHAVHQSFYSQPPAFNNQISHGDYKVEVSKYLGAYLALGADPSVCFVGFPFSSSDFSLGRPYYIDLATMLGIWDVQTPVGIPTNAAWASSNSGWWLHRFLSRKAAPDPSDPQPISYEDANMDLFWLVAVVPLENLKEVPLPEASRAWEETRLKILRVLVKDSRSPLRCTLKAWRRGFHRIQPDLADEGKPIVT
ncbi:hypothetical protein B0T11DRAFT_53324 [Plectosphaerella cucumerina]|uniref:NACHT domain-containing protein n=1 Tax=Plectosphaerella cucumerina TaxID=40658 RepID=A0A8K0X6A6_9PEZI|nr:hypothetical protein B0T11DRAFT_53324 [Plectosphaerella cucumerina]